MTFTVSTPYSVCSDCVFSLGQYANNDHIAISIVSLSEGPYANLTVNIPMTDSVPENFGFVDTNNFPDAVTLINNLGIGEYTGLNGSSGFCSYPLYIFDEDAIKKYMRLEE